MRQRFSYDFSTVRVFADSNAAASARALDAYAYTIGQNIVFGERQYSPRTRSGESLLAHELAHVLQQQHGPSPQIMRMGVTARGFFANLFQSWDYSKETLNAFLNTLNVSGEIIGDDDSDDMARQVAAEWKADKSAYPLTPKLKVLLIREMLDGAVLGSDQEGIITILEGSNNTDLKAMIGGGPEQITFEEIHAQFGVMKERLELFDKEVLRKLEDIKPPPEEGESLLEMLEKGEKQTGLRVEDLSVSFRMSPDTLVEGFLANIVVPETGSLVTITLTRTNLQIAIEPGIVIDVIGPINPVLQGVKFRFKGMKSEIVLDAFSETANEVAAEFIQELLAGTRFADPSYDFSRDPHLISEYKDPSVIGDINRIKYNLQKTASKDPEDKEENAAIKAKALDMTSGADAALKLVHPKGDRFPKDDDGWGLRIPKGTTLRLELETEGKASEMMQMEARLMRVGIHGSGVFIVKGQDDLVELFGFDILPGLEFDLGEFREKKDLKELLKTEAPGELSETIAGAAADLDALSDALRSESQPRSNVAHDLAEWIVERALSLALPFLVGLFWDTIRDFTPMTDRQLSKFFGLSAPEKK